MLKLWNKSWDSFGSCLLNSTADPIRFHQSCAGLAVLFSRQLPNGFHWFFLSYYIFIILFLKVFIYETIETPSFLTHIILTIRGVFYLSYMHLEMYNGNFWWILQFLNGLLGCNFGNSQENKSKYSHYPKSRPTYIMLKADCYTIFGPIHIFLGDQNQP